MNKYNYIIHEYDILVKIDTINLKYKGCVKINIEIINDITDIKITDIFQILSMCNKQFLSETSSDFEKFDLKVLIKIDRIIWPHLGCHPDCQ